MSSQFDQIYEDNMNKFWRTASSIFLTFSISSFALSGIAQTPSTRTTGTIDATTRVQVVDALIRELNAQYVFPDIAKSAEQLLRRKQTAGEYELLTRGEDFASALTADLRAVSEDRHLAVTYKEPLLPTNDPSNVQSVTPLRGVNAPSPFGGIGTVEKLPGNIGYLQLQSFAPVNVADKAITAAMMQLADSDALIIDLRENRGGHGNTVVFALSYLFDKRIHLYDVYWREGNVTEQLWTNVAVPGQKYGSKKAVYVLTSKRTFSAAEAFCDTIKSLERATIIGEATGGGANPARRGNRLTSEFVADIPTGRAINLITKKNWETTGVVPDVLVPAKDALLVAQRMALKELAKVETNPQHLLLLRERQAELAQIVSGS